MQGWVRDKLLRWKSANPTREALDTALRQIVPRDPLIYLTGNGGIRFEWPGTVWIIDPEGQLKIYSREVKPEPTITIIDEETKQ